MSFDVGNNVIPKQGAFTRWPKKNITMLFLMVFLPFSGRTYILSGTPRSAHKTQIVNMALKAAKFKCDWAGHICRMPSETWAKFTEKISTIGDGGIIRPFF